MLYAISTAKSETSLILCSTIQVDINMNATSVQRALADLPLGPLRYFDTIGSTNAEAARWAQQDAPDLSLVVADEQTAGRGRHGRRWHTPPGAALAFSLVLRPEKLPNLNLQMEEQKQSQRYLTRLAALGALAVCDGLEAYGRQHTGQIQPMIKWPNDVLADGRKLSGVLVESHWEGKRLTAVILGIGINVAPASIPEEGQLSFPAACVAEILAKPVNRLQLLHQVLKALVDRRNQLSNEEFILAWERHLAYVGQRVRIFQAVTGDDASPVEGDILGLSKDGALRLQTPSGESLNIHSGEVHLRPVDRSLK